MAISVPAQLPFLLEGGEAGALMRALDWEKTAMGPPAGWPQSLKTAVSLLLRARQPMFIGWGKDLVSIYNDGYIPICGGKHPQALGQPMAAVWKEIWDSLSPLNDAVLRGESLWFENQPFDLGARGNQGPSYFTFSYTPLLDDQGSIGGIFCSAVETTATVVLAQHTANETARLQRLFKQAPGFICTFSGPDHVYEFINDAHVRLFQRPDIIGKPVREAFPDVADQGFYAALDQVYRSGERHVATNVRTRLRDTPDAPEREVVLDFIFAPVLAPDGRVTGIFCEGQDVSAAQAARQALLEKEEQLRLATDAAEVGMWDSNVETGWMYWAPRVRAMFGITGDQPLTLDDFYRGVHPDDREATLAAFAAASDPARRVVYDVEYRTVGREDGRVRWVAAKGRGLFDADGVCRRVIGTAIDITARKDVELAMEVALEASRTGTFHWNIQANTLSWDAALDRLFGVVPGQVVRSLEQFVLLVHPDDRAEVVARCERCRDEAADFEMEFRVVYPDGSIHWLYDRGRTFVDADGRAKTMTGACVDVTQRREAEAALRASELFYRRTLESVPGITYTATADGACDYLSDQWTRYTGQPAAEALGDGWLQALHPQDRPLAASAWTQAVRDGNRFAAEFRLQRRDGGCGWFQSQASMIPAAGSVPARWIGGIHDIHELKQAQEALRGADRQKDDFLATLAHELRNPLAPLRTGLDLLKKADASTDQRRVRDIMGRQLNHMVRLVDELLDVARISQGKIALQRETLPLQTVLDQAVEAARPWLDANAHQLEVQAAQSAWHVNGDLTRLVQVVGNLLNNAAKYTPPSGRIALRASEEREGFAISVEDNGVGIPNDLLQRVFDRFVQADHPTTRAQGGLGIGLSVVKSLVEMHGGSVSADSAGPGCGSRFTLWLPRAAAPAPETRDGADPVPAAPTVPRKILIVDDNRDAAETLAMIVGLSGHEVHLAHDGSSALLIAQQQEPDIVFLDIGMPGMNGYEAAVKLRALPGWQDRLLVALTGWGGEEDRAKSLRAGFNVHLTKPVDLQALDSLLAQARGQAQPSA